MSYKLEELPNSHGLLGEGPHWDIETQSLYFVDIDNAKLFRYDYEQNKTYSAIVEGENLASFIIPVDGESGKFAVGCGRRVAVVAWDGVSPSAKVERIAYSVQPGDEFSSNRINDGKADPRGRLFAGTMFPDIMTKRTGELYRFEKGKPVAPIKSEIGISNGLAWNEKTNKFYYIDTMDLEVKEYDYDFDTGVPSNPKVVFKHAEHWPDGMTIDSEGNIYIATFTGHTVYKVNPRTSEILQEIKLPTKQITSVAFGGPNLDILFVTTSAYFDQPAPAGNTFKVTGLGVKGLPMSKVKI
ncbi:PREDICTED: regucalcin-like [Rhagoletis zephyria]|uniref:regucalcin-like n=1 Tax=Rhagoletis zephyria TaxID=28612 RepID=UPI000811A9B3|nr:PREDICTED: regucalcin-like [Rhagoletis zephyria]XP_017463962.1 PREDICTED: regucalcin-like [Rhagoletis zephyria]XP_017463968.1 PREDICTED: regucalcin-like [Rhagoletis zephyria]